MYSFIYQMDEMLLIVLNVHFQYNLRETIPRKELKEKQWVAHIISYKMILIFWIRIVALSTENSMQSDQIRITEEKKNT